MCYQEIPFQDSLGIPRDSSLEAPIASSSAMTTLTVPELAHLLLALGLLLAAAHGFGYAMSRLNQPRVIGESPGGVARPNRLGAVAPRLPAAVLLSSTAARRSTPVAAGAAASHVQRRGGDPRVVPPLRTAGCCVISLVGMSALRCRSRGRMSLQIHTLRESGSTNAAFVIAFGIAIAITSIPTSSHHADLGRGHVLCSDRARGCRRRGRLAVRAPRDRPRSRGPRPRGLVGTATDARNPAGQRGERRVSRRRRVNLPRRVSHIRPVVLRSLAGWVQPRETGEPDRVPAGVPVWRVVAAIYLGVVPIFGAFVAGIVVSTPSGEGATGARESLNAFSFAFFIPVYFAIVGMRLDLLQEFSIWFFVPFFAFACLVKSVSVYAGARLGGEGAASSGTSPSP